MREIADRQALDAMLEMGCGNAGCNCASDPLYFVAKCHPAAGLTVNYSAKQGGVITAACKECGLEVIAMLAGGVPAADKTS